VEKSRRNEKESEKESEKRVEITGDIGKKKRKKWRNSNTGKEVFCM